MKEHVNTRPCTRKKEQAIKENGCWW